MDVLKLVFLVMRSLFVSRAALAAENLALRQQLAVLQRAARRPGLRRRDRVSWVWLSRIWRNWRSVVVIVRPETVVRWHRQGFRSYWGWRSRTRIVGRPTVEAEIRDLVRRMCRENSWGAPRIQSELRLLGYEVAESTVAKYMFRPRKPPSHSETRRTPPSVQTPGGLKKRPSPPSCDSTIAEMRRPDRRLSWRPK